ncbi:MAG: toxin TcdB middle/N-terminal domain-containing protein [Myxococcota bacterium]
MRPMLLALVCLLSFVCLADKSGTRPQLINVPKGPGSVSGLGESFQVVLNSGSATESIPIKLPPGTAGMTPQLAITYDSGSGNGELGIGWSLPVASMQLQTEKGLPRYSGQDTWLLSGAELVKLPNGTWRLKNEGRFVRVRQSGAHFEVDLPSGNTQRFGLSPESRIEDAGRVFQLMLEEEVDRFQNRISYFYEKHGGRPSLTRIEYNRRAGAAQNHVELEWEQRPDVLTDYKPGFKTVAARRLKRIRVFGGTSQLARYEFTYVMGTGLSLLDSVVMFGDDDRTTFPPLTFEYSGMSNGAHPSAMSNGPVQLPGSNLDAELTDFDGDGFVDVLVAATGQHQWARNIGGLRFAAPRPVAAAPNVALQTTGVELGDMNGDGLADLLAHTGTTAFRYFAASGDGDWRPAETFTSMPSFNLEDGATRLVDLDFDKLPDVLRVAPNGVSWWRNNGAGDFEPAVTLPLLSGQTTVDFADPRFKLVDVNGDRLVDIAFVRSASLMYWPGMGRGRFDAPVELSDVPDVGALESRLQFADLTGDGLPDLVLVDTEHVDFWKLGAGERFEAKQSVANTPFANAGLTQVRLADMNANGSLDVVYFTPSAVPDERVVYVDLQPGMRANLLTRVANGLGMTRRLAYTSSSEEFQLAQEAGTPWQRRVPFPVQVVAGVVLSDSLGADYVTQYRYREGHYERATREFRGFGVVVQTDEGDDDEPSLETEHVFEVLSETLRGRELSVEARATGGFRFSRITRTWTPRVYELGTGGVNVTGAELTSETTLIFEGRSSPVETQRTFVYDAFGNVVEDHQLGRTDRTGDESVQLATWANKLDEWILGRPVEQKSLGADGAPLTITRHYYDGDAFQGLPLGELTRGAETRTEAWVEGTRWVQQSRIERDEFGNPIEMRTPRGARREIEWDPTHTFPVLERLWIDDSRKLEFKATYKNAMGLVASFTDSNSSVSQYRWDALHRLTAIAQAGDSLDQPTVSWVYELANPYSRLRMLTRVRDGEDTETQDLFDGLGRKVATQHLIENDQVVVEGRKRYSRRGSVLEEWDSYFASSLELTAPGTPAVKHRYDALGRVVSSTFEDGTRAEMRRGPLWVENWDALDLTPGAEHANTPMRHEFDGLGRLVKTVELLKDKPLTTEFLFDAAGRRAGVVLANQQRVEYVFDGLSRLTRVKHPEAGTRTWEYDDDGNGTVARDALGQATVRSYDGAGRIITESLVDAAGVDTGTIRYFYDETSVGDLSRVVDLAGEESFTYDARRRLVSNARTFEGKTYTLSLKFDNLDHATEITYPDESVIKYSFNKRGLVSAIEGFVEAVEYNAKGLAVRRALANGVVSTAGYDDHDRVKDIRSASRAGKELQNLEFAYSPVGSLERITDRVNTAGQLSSSFEFTYDSLMRLKDARGPAGVLSHQYDDVGNLLQKSDVGAYAYEDLTRPSVLTAVGGRPMVTNANGQMTVSLGRTFTWDPRGELRKVETEEATTEYLYDYTGQRTLKRVTRGGTSHQTLYLDKYSEVRDGALVKYVYLGEARIARVGGALPKTVTAMASLGGAASSLAAAAAMLLAMAALLLQKRKLAVRTLAVGLAVLLSSCSCGPQSRAVYYLDNHLGSHNIQLNDAGEVLAQSNFDVWGNPIVQSDEPYGFIGAEFDAEAGLQYLNSRYYDVRLGRFISPDLSLLAGADEAQDDPQVLNLYSYSRNTPTSLRDKSGQFGHIVIGALIGGGIGAAVYLAKAAWNGETATVQGTLAAAAGGAVAGGLAAATGGASLLVTGGVSGMAGGIVERGVKTGSLSEAFDVNSMAGDFVMGTVTAGVVKGGAGLLKAAAPTLKKIGGSVATKVGGAIKKGVDSLKSACAEGACKITGKGCFVAGTLVLLASGEHRPIEQIQPGDLVIAVDERGVASAQPVLNAWSLLASELVDVTIEGADGSRETITATPEHPFLLTSGEFAEARSLQPLVELGGVVGRSRVLSVNARVGSVPVFNLEIAEHHNYAVGQNSSIVHNNGCHSLAIDDLVSASKQSQSNLFKPPTPPPPLPRKEFLKNLATKLGFRKTNFESHGQAVYTDGKRYISFDVDSHNGGAFKMANTVEGLKSKQTRLGTFNEALERIGD